MSDAKKMQAVLNEVEQRLKDNELDLLDADIIRDSVRSHVDLVLEKQGLSMESFRTLAGISNEAKVSLFGLPLSKAERNLLHDELAKSSFLKPIIPLTLDKPPETTFKFKPEVFTSPAIGMMALMDTEVSSGDPYRGPGRRTIEDVLKEAEIPHKVYVKINYDDWDPEPLTADQRQLISRLMDAHPNLEFLYELPQSTAITIGQSKKPGALARLWRMISCLWSQ